MSPLASRVQSIAAFAVTGLLASILPASAQERWTPELIICGNASTWVWHKAGDPCASSPAIDAQGNPILGQDGNPLIVPAVHPPAVFDGVEFVSDPAAAYLNKPNAFIEVVKPAAGQTPAIHQLLIADSLNGRILRFNDDGVNVTYAGELAHGTFLQPFGIVGDADGNILVADQARNRVFIFDWNGNPIGGALDGQGMSTGAYVGCTPNAQPFSSLPFSLPWRIAVTTGTSVTPGHEQGQVLVIDGGDNRVIVCDGQMNFIATFGNPVDVSGGDPSFFNSPTGIAIDQTGHIYVADQNNGRIQVFDATTPAKLAALTLGSAPVWIISADPASDTVVPTMSGPFGVAIDANGRLLAADQDNNAMYVFDTFAKGLKQLNVRIGTASEGTVDNVPPLPPGPAGELQVPANIALDSIGRLLIADVWNQRVQRFNHPAMTVTVAPPSSPVFDNGDIVLTVEVQAASGTFLSVIPIAHVTGNATLTGPEITPDANADPNAPGTTVTAGLGPTTFTVRFHSTGQGTVSFSVMASGIPQGSSVRIEAPDGAGDTEPIPVGVASDTTTPVTTATISGTAVVVGTGAAATTWYTTPPVVHLATTGNPTPFEIDYATAPFQPAPNSNAYVVCAGTTCDLPAITADGATLLWFRAKNAGATEPWQSLIVHYDGVIPSVGSFTLTPKPNTAGWNNSAFTVSYFISKGEVGLPAGVANPGAIVIAPGTQPDSANVVPPKVTILDAAGLSSGPVAFGPFKLDTTPPSANCSVSSIAGPNAAGWYKNPVNVTFLATDALSGISGSPTSVTILNTDGNALSASIGAGFFQDLAGNSTPSPITCAGIKIDMTPPTVSVSTTINPAANGWFNLATGKPTVKFTPNDPGAQASGLAAGSTAVQSVSITADTLGTTLTSNTFADVAGNTASGSYAYKMDTVAPTLSIPSLSGPGGLAANALGVFNLAGQQPTAGVTVNVTAADAAPSSGVQVCYDLTGGATCTPAASAGAGAFALTVLNSVTNASVWAIDGAGNKSAARQFSVNITRTAATNANPSCSAVSADPNLLWPPNHKFVAIGITGVTDADGDAPAIAVTKIWQDESTMADGSGDTPIDATIVNGVAWVRAERSGEGDGRVYQIFFTATDSKGGSCSGSVTVGVPHDQGNSPAIDSGVRYDSLVANGPPVSGTPPNHKPVATADSATLLKGDSTIIAVLANDTDADGDTLKIVATTTPSHGTVTVNANGTITYNGAPGYGGTDSFTYTVSDGRGGTATATVTLTINAHSDGDGCAHDRSRGWHDEDDCDHDRDCDRRHDSRWRRW
jgi:hypothetical protein